jgi:predicted anti-sigma-YlaC factor YlaD
MPSVRISPRPVFRSLTIFLVGMLAGLSSCTTIGQLTAQMTADALTGVGKSTVFTGDEDPELVGDSLPMLLKVHEVLLEQLPTHEGLNLQTGSLTVMYANAFVQGPAELLGADQGTEKKTALERARKLYLRADRVLSAALERKFPGLKASFGTGTSDVVLKKAQKADVPFLYWDAAAILSAFAQSPLDIGLSVRVKEAKALVDRAYALDPDWGNGTLDELYIAFYGSMPPSLGGDKALAKEHFDAAVKKEQGKGAGPYVAYATAVSLPDQDYPGFRRLVDQALAVNLDDAPELRLVNTLAQRKAAWLVAHKDDLFLDTETP